jgi:hypothetical protein
VVTMKKKNKNKKSSGFLLTTKNAQYIFFVRVYCI